MRGCIVVLFGGGVAITGTPDGGQVGALELLERFCSFYWSYTWQAGYVELARVESKPRLQYLKMH
jgi:hypothetical protein